MVDWEDHLENNSNNNNSNNSIEISRVLEVSVSHQVRSCVKLLNSASLIGCSFPSKIVPTASSSDHTQMDVSVEADKLGC